MKQITVLVLFLVIFFPAILQAQWKRETGIVVGTIIPDYPKDYTYYEKVGFSKKLGLIFCWNNQDKKLSFRPEVGMNFELLSVDGLYRGGLGGGTTYDGTILSINGLIAPLAQMKMTKRLYLAIGPVGKYLLTDLTKMTESWFLATQSPPLRGANDKNGFNRYYLHKPSLGIKAMLLERNIGEKISVGLSLERHWKASSEYFFDFSRTTEVSLYVGLH